MGIFKENNLSSILPDEITNSIEIREKNKRVRKEIEGQVSFESLGINLKKEVGLKKSELKVNEIKYVPDEHLPVERRYLNSNNVAFVKSSNIAFVRRNIKDFSMKESLRGTNSFLDKTDEEMVKKLVVFPNKTELYDYHSGVTILFPGGILALPVRTSGDWGKEQSFIYVGNFSDDEKRNKKSNTGYYRADNDKPLVWRFMRSGQELPANDHKAIRVEISVNDKNEVKAIYK